MYIYIIIYNHIYIYTQRASTLLRLAREDTWLPLGINPLQWRQRPGKKYICVYMYIGVHIYIYIL